MFDAHAPGTSNDRIEFITRAELMQAVAPMILKRIAGEASSGLVEYRSSMAAFPAPDIDGDGYPDPGHAYGNVPYKVLTYSYGVNQMLILNDWFSLAGYAIGPGSQTAELSLHENKIALQ